MQLLEILTFTSLLALCTIAEGEDQRSELATSLGLAMSLSPHQQSLSSSEAPDFLLDMYNCWSSSGRSMHDCMPYPVMDRTTVEDVNIIRAIKGTAQETTTVLSYEFDVSVMQTAQEIFHYAYICLPKEALSVEELTSVQEKCNTQFGVQLTLSVQAFSDSIPIVSTAMLNPADLGEQLMINFTGFTQIFRESLNDGASAPKRFHFNLSVNGSCDSLLRPADLGVISTDGSHPWIVAFSTSLNTKRHRAFLQSGLTELAKQTGHNKRQAERAPEDEAESPAYIPSRESPCRTYAQKVSFSELGWGHNIIRPDGFDINYCLGKCKFPQISNPNYNTTKHSHIQSIAEFYNANRVPPPCCVPHQYTDVEVLYEQLPGVFVTHRMIGIAAKSCGCK